MKTVSVTAKKDNEKEFWTNVNAGGILIIDNLDSKVPWIADAIENYSTGGCDARRKLYKDSDIIYNRPNAWLGITSCKPDFISSPALADRTLVVRMKARTGKTQDDSLTKEIEANRNGGLTWICNTLVKALSVTGEIKQTIRRHPDFGDFAGRLGRAMDIDEQVIRCLKEAEEDKSRANLENDWLGEVLLSNIHEPWSGSADDLKTKLVLEKKIDGNKVSTKSVSHRLNMIKMHLEKVFSASCQMDSHSKVLIWSFTPPEGVAKSNKDDEFAGFAGIKRGVLDKLGYLLDGSTP